MFFGFKLHQETGTTQGFFKTNKPTSIQEALELIRMKYVDSIGLDSLQQDALNEMMNELDPHSIYIPATNLKEVNEDIIGNFEGIGVEFNIFSDTYEPFFHGAALLFVEWLILYWMYRRKIFLRI